MNQSLQAVPLKKTRHSALLASLCAIGLCFTLAGCSSSGSGDDASDNDSAPTPPATPAEGMSPDETVTGMVPTETNGNIETDARYRITFTASWSAETHPQQFPFNPHFSPLTGATHNEQVIFWEPGQLATDGIELMAETGATSLFQGEVDEAIASGYADKSVNVGSIATSPGSRSSEFEININNPMLTLTSMLAPSPDWFVGVHNLMLHDGQQFIDQLTVDLDLYDSGTDSGPGYTSTNDDTQPREPITKVTSDSGDSPFVDGKPIVGQLILEKI